MPGPWDRETVRARARECERMCEGVLRVESTSGEGPSTRRVVWCRLSWRSNKKCRIWDGGVVCRRLFVLGCWLAWAPGPVVIRYGSDRSRCL